MKTLFCRLYLALIALALHCMVEGSEINFAALGSVENAENAVAKQAQGLSVSIKQLSPSGEYIHVKHISYNVSFSSKAEADAFYVKKLTEEVGPYALTSTEVDPRMPFTTFAFTALFGGVNEDIPVSDLYRFSNFNLVESPDGTFHLPDFSGYKLRLTGSLTFPLAPGTERVRIEARGVLPLDSLINPPGDESGGNEINIPVGYIKLSTSLLTSRTSGLKISVFSQDENGFDFGIYTSESNGQRVPETPTQIVSMITGTNGPTALVIKGGNIGRAVIVQSKSCSGYGVWTDCGYPYFLRTGREETLNLDTEKDFGNHSIFRVRTVDMIQLPAESKKP